MAEGYVTSTRSFPGEPYVAAVYLSPISSAHNFLGVQLISISFTEAIVIATKRDIDRAGNFGYLVECEDQDFCWAAVLHGFKIVCLQDAIVHHFGRKMEKSSYLVLERTVYLYFRNHIFTLIKNLELLYVQYYVLEKYLIELCKVLVILCIRRNLELALIFEGVVAFFKIQQSKSIPDKQRETFSAIYAASAIELLRASNRRQKVYLLDHQLLLRFGIQRNNVS